jgi:hypothetical protein
MTRKDSIREFGTFLGNGESELERNHPRIVEQIKLLWGYEEFYLYLDRLSIVEKERNRQGFSPEVILELDKLREIHEERFPSNHHDKSSNHSHFW